MKLQRIGLGAACALILCLGPATARSQYLLTGGSGAQLQTGVHVALPLGPAGIFLGGMTPVNGGTSCGMGVGGCSIVPDGPGTPFWPPLLVKPNSNISTGGVWTRTIQQNLSTSMGGAIVVPPRVLSRPAPGAPAPIAVFPFNPAVFQAATTLSFAWPAATATLAPGGAPGPAAFWTGATGPVVFYSGGSKAFGGPGRFALSPGPGAGSGRVPPNTLGAPPVLTRWINVFGALPASATRVAIVAQSAMALALPGAPAPPAGATLTATSTAMFGPVASGFGFVNGSLVPTPTGPIPCPPACPVGPLGTITASLPIAVSIPSDAVTFGKGLPWTTGFITISQPGHVPPQIFFLSGTDMRVNGVGNISLVSGALSHRTLTGPTANRGWLSLTLPEPPAGLAAAAALAMLGLCHALLRRDSSGNETTTQVQRTTPP